MLLLLLPRLTSVVIIDDPETVKKSYEPIFARPNHIPTPGISQLISEPEEDTVGWNDWTTDTPTKSSTGETLSSSVWDEPMDKTVKDAESLQDTWGDEPKSDSSHSASNRSSWDWDTSTSSTHRYR